MSSSRRALGFGFLLASLLNISACSEAPAPGECAKLFDHILDMQTASSNGSEADKAKNKATLEGSKKEGFVERCDRNIRAVQVRCSLGATTMDAIDACDSQG